MEANLTDVHNSYDVAGGLNLQAVQQALVRD